MTTIQQAEDILQTAELIYDADKINLSIQGIAQQLNTLFSKLEIDQPVIILCVMNGGLIFSGQLIPYLTFPLVIDYLHATRYRDNTTGGELNWIAEPVNKLQDRNVLILDDILDEGYTLLEIQKYCQQKKSKNIVSAVLLEKMHQRRTENVSCDVIGLSVADRYVFGFGMDYKSFHRNLNGIYALADEAH